VTEQEKEALIEARKKDTLHAGQRLLRLLHKESTKRLTSKEEDLKEKLRQIEGDFLKGSNVESQLLRMQGQGFNIHEELIERWKEVKNRYDLREDERLDRLAPLGYDNNRVYHARQTGGGVPTPREPQHTTEDRLNLSPRGRPRQPNGRSHSARSSSFLEQAPLGPMSSGSGASEEVSESNSFVEVRSTADAWGSKELDDFLMEVEIKNWRFVASGVTLEELDPEEAPQELLDALAGKQRTEADEKFAQHFQ
ncbi:unnamed protein product, partial [Amoebophrya sp. A120]